MEPFAQALRTIPLPLRPALEALPSADQTRVEELRLRVGRPMGVVLPRGERVLNGPLITPDHLDQLVELACGASRHAVGHQLRRGYLTLAGGHRLGLCGTAVLREGEVWAISPLSSASLRIARAVPGAGEGVLPALCPQGRLVSTLILAPPGWGKTTLLRDLVRRVSDGMGCEPLRISLADERGEVAALYRGVPQLDVGGRTDVLEGCPKGEGMMLLLRAMNPQVLAADEITDPTDVAALLGAVGCGVTLLATAHGETVDDLGRRPLYRPLLEEGCFRRLVRIVDRARHYVVEELS